MPIRIDDIKQFGGRTGFLFKDLTTKETVTYNADEKIEAASVIKLFVMAEYFSQVRDGLLDPDGKRTVEEDEKLPSCGALRYMSKGTTVTWRDLCTLMIILSDNTATNILIKKLGIGNINNTIKENGFTGTSLNRLLFDAEASARGIQNYVTAADCGQFLDMISNGTLISCSASSEMLNIMKNQRLNGKIPFYLHSYTDAEIAHKTGEDSGITHDVGIVYGKHPFIICYLSQNVDVPLFERYIQDKSYEIYKETGNEE